MLNYICVGHSVKKELFPKNIYSITHPHPSKSKPNRNLQVSIPHAIFEWTTDLLLQPLKRNSEMIKMSGCKKDLTVEDFFVPMVICVFLTGKEMC